MWFVSSFGSVFYYWVCVVLVLQFSTVSCLCPEGTRCVPKCCPIGKIKTSKGCIPGGNGLHTPKGILIVQSQPDCWDTGTGMYRLKPGENVFEHCYNGTIIVNEMDSMVPHEDFCLDEDELNETYVYVCFPPPKEDTVQEEQLRVYSVGLFISLPFIFATFLVYAFIKHKILRTLHAKCVKYHNLCLFLSYSVLGLVQNNMFHTDAPCFIVGKLAPSLY
nr:uncharacterized protein LOC106687727 [Halyomorpha halys]